MYKPEVVRHLVSAYENTGEPNPQCIGYHGTSLETIKYVLKNGILPGTMIRTNQQTAKDYSGWHPYGTLYFCPTIEGLPFPNKEYAPYTLQEALEETSGYAEDSAQSHRFLAMLNLPFDDPISKSASLFLTNDYFPGDEESEKVLQGLLKERPNLQRSHIELVLEHIKILQPKGFVLGLNRALLDSKDITKLDLEDDESEFRMHVPNGLNFKYICSIEPMGPTERESLNGLHTESWWPRLTQFLGNRL